MKQEIKDFVDGLDAEELAELLEHLARRLREGGARVSQPLTRLEKQKGFFEAALQRLGFRAKQLALEMGITDAYFSELRSGKKDWGRAGPEPSQKLRSLLEQNGLLDLYFLL